MRDSSPAPPNGPFGAPDALETERLFLRPLTSADVPAVFAYASRPGFFLYLDHVPLAERQSYQPEHAASHVAALQDLAVRGWPQWGLVPRQAGPRGQPIGAIRFHPEHDGGLDPELGYGLHPAWWGEGLATEAARAVLAWTQRAHPAVQRVVARCHPANAASRAVLLKAGFLPAQTDPRGRLAFCWTAPNLNPAATSPVST